MQPFQPFCDHYFANMNLQTELRLPRNRESVLHFFEQVRKRYPHMTNLYARQRDEYVLDSEKQEGRYSWLSLEPRQLTSGCINPATLQEAIEQHQNVLEIAPYALSLGPLDCETMNFTLGFDYDYRGNHSQLLSEALGTIPALERLADIAPGPILGYEPTIQFALSDDCKTQCRISFETRSTAYQVRSGEYGEDSLSVYLLVRRYGSLLPDENFCLELERLANIGQRITNDFMIENILQPLQRAIALR